MQLQVVDGILGRKQHASLYHYINHRTTDYLCRKYCNPAPLNGSAPNLVAVELDKAGRPHFKRAFNTQVYTSMQFKLMSLISYYRHLSN